MSIGAFAPDVDATDEDAAEVEEAEEEEEEDEEEEGVVGGVEHTLVVVAESPLLTILLLLLLLLLPFLTNKRTISKLPLAADRLRAVLPNERSRRFTSAEAASSSETDDAWPWLVS